MASEEIGRHKAELAQIEIRARLWYMNRLLLLYVCGAVAFIGLGFVFFGRAELRAAGIGLALMTAMALTMAIGGFLYFSWREQEHRREIRRATQMREALKPGRER
jgi:predicted phage tail protein